MLNTKQKKILALAYLNTQGIVPGDCFKIYTTTHHIKDVMRHLHLAGYLKENALGRFIITEKGKAELGIEVDTKLNRYIEADASTKR